jgi:hypothetical protein
VFQPLCFSLDLAIDHGLEPLPKPSAEGVGHVLRKPGLTTRAEPRQDCCVRFEFEPHRLERKLKGLYAVFS